MSIRDTFVDYVKYTLETLFEPFGYVHVVEGPRTELSVQRVLNNPYLLAKIMRHLCAIDRVRNIMATLRVSRAFRNPHVIKETMRSIRTNIPTLRRLPHIHTMTCIDIDHANDTETFSTFNTRDVVGYAIGEFPDYSGYSVSVGTCHQEERAFSGLTSIGYNSFATQSNQFTVALGGDNAFQTTFDVENEGARGGDGCHIIVTIKGVRYKLPLYYSD